MKNKYIPYLITVNLDLCKLTYTKTIVYNKGGIFRDKKLSFVT
jgi:hypothetical protein